jgi:hypothetical protein
MRSFRKRRRHLPTVMLMDAKLSSAVAIERIDQRVASFGVERSVHSITAAVTEVRPVETRRR